MKLSRDVGQTVLYGSLLGLCAVFLHVLGAPFWMPATAGGLAVFLTTVSLSLTYALYRRDGPPRGSGLRCSECRRPIERGEFPDGGVDEWIERWTPARWVRQELLSCRHCSRMYCAECAPSFFSLVQVAGEPLFPEKKCACGRREFDMVVGRQKGTSWDTGT